MAILQLRAARGWSLEQTAKTFLITAATVGSWITRIDEQGPDALLQISEPVNKFTQQLLKEEWVDPEATSAIRVKVEIQPGLPVGFNHQTIHLETNKVDIAPIDVAVEISIVSDISVLGGRNFNDDNNLLSLGPVPKSTGREVQLHLMVKGKYRDQVEFSVVEIDPEEALAVEFGDPVEISSGIARRFPLKLMVKPNSPSIQRMGSKQGRLGKIRFNTKHPEIQQFEIKVQFAVQ